MARISKEKLKTLALKHNLRVSIPENTNSVHVYDENGSLLFSQTGGQKVSKALQAINEYVELEKVALEGSVRPLANFRTFPSISTLPSDVDREWDLEVKEVPVRDACLGAKLIDMKHNCSIANSAIDLITMLTFSSYDGDEIGFTISPYHTDGKTSINPKVYDILLRLIEEVIGGTNLTKAVSNFLFYGDAFCSLGLDLESKNKGVKSLLWLPTWEMFRVVDNQNRLLRFDQRRYLSDTDCVKFLPVSVVHWRYDIETIYGKALFQSCLREWDYLKNAEDDLKDATKTMGVNPIVHSFPSIISDTQISRYKDNIEYKRRRGEVITDYYMLEGGNISRLSEMSQDLGAMVDSIKHWSNRIITKSHVPPYLLGEISSGANEISNQPALIFSQFINYIRQHLSSGIRQICNLELLINDIPREEWVYNLEFPKIQTNIFSEVDDEQSEGIEDLDDKVNSSSSYQNDNTRLYSTDELKTMINIQKDMNKASYWSKDALL